MIREGVITGMLVTLKEVLQDAEKNQYAVGAFNVPTFESLRAALDAAEELQTPIILAHAEVHSSVMPLEFIGPILVNCAKKANVPVVVHLDHGSDIKLIEQAINLGFTSVMIDASHKPYDENVKTVQEVVEFAHKFNVSVEAELGVITSSGIGGEETENHITSDSILTDPHLAKDFVEKTNIDALAASIGTVHGIYMSQPNIDYERIKTLHDLTKIPIVMHGGSGLSKEEYLKTIESGVRKINYYSYSAKYAAEAIKEYINKNNNVFYHELTFIAKKVIEQDLRTVIKIFRNN